MTARTPIGRFAPRTVFVLGALIGGSLVGLFAAEAARFAPTSRSAFVADYDGRVLDDGLELLIVQSDGQAYATLARDPLLDRAAESFRSPEEAAYRAQRPLLPLAAWALSAGRTGWVPPALALLAAIGAGFAASGAAALLVRRGMPAWLGLVAVVLPGTVNALSFLGPEPLVLGLTLWGINAWERDRRWPAVGIFVLAVLGRESALLVPFALGLTQLRRRHLRQAAMLLPVPATLACWYLTLRARLDAWPWAAGPGRIGPPLAGFLEAVPERWETPAMNGGLLLLGVLVVAGCGLLARDDHLSVIVAVHAAFATVLGKYVWEEIPGFGRVLLPMYVIGLIAIAGSQSRATGTAPSAHEPRSPSRR